jgi:ribonucleoside-diphosphate reductase alpha chain
VCRQASQAVGRKTSAGAATRESAISVLDEGVRKPLDMEKLTALVESACEGLGSEVDPQFIIGETLKNIYDGVPLAEVRKSAILSARALIEKDPAYSRVTARLLLHTVRRSGQ